VRARGGHGAGIYFISKTCLNRVALLCVEPRLICEFDVEEVPRTTNIGAAERK
jgi:hypothetical protein